VKESPTRVSDELRALLRCPQCLRGAMTLLPDARALRCDACALQLPLLDGIPWMFAEPQVRLAEWRQRYRLAESELAARRRDAEAALADPGLSPVTRQRLEPLAAALIDQVARLRSVLEPIEPGASIARHETLLALRTRTPLSQDLASYYPNLHRDWSWGAEENRAAVELVGELLANEPPGTLLVPGAGAGRLAWDVHQELGPRHTVALDLNPLLLLVAARLARGGSAALYEFPIAPRRASDAAVLRELVAPAATRPGLDFVFGDALRAPFRPAAFDTVLTPWLVDIVPQPFASVAAGVAALLRPGGRWLNIGSLAFAQSSARLNHGPEEVCELLAAAGFAAPRVIERRIPYMQSPASRHARLETVFAFEAELVQVTSDAPESDNLPGWLAGSGEPVPMLPYFEARALANRIYAFVMALVDGRRNTAEIAAYLVAQKLMLPGEAEPAVREFLATLYEESRRRDSF
jgi:uncharacterized protein YbaR (Trm112 family)